MPLRVSQHSKGEGIAPPECWTFLIRRNGPSSLLATTTPPITSEWPPRYFVVACMTRSASRSKVVERCIGGVTAPVAGSTPRPACTALVSILNRKPPFFSAASRTARRAVPPREGCRLVVAVVVAYNRTRSLIFGKSYSSQASPRIGFHSRREQPPAAALGRHSREDRL